MTCVILAVFPFGSGRKPWFFHTLSFFSVLTKHWSFMTADSLILFASLLPSLSLVSHFHTFSSLSETLSSPLFLSLSLLGAAPAVWEQIALLLLGFGEWTRPWSHLWESQLSICNHNVQCLLVSEGWSYMPLGTDLQIGLVILMVERRCLQCFLSAFL